MGHGVKLSEMAEKMQLKNLTPDVDLAEKEVTVPDVNRPALQLAGYFDHFDSERVQIIGYVEHTYLQTLEPEKKKEIYKELLACQVPCLIFSKDLYPDEDLLELAKEADIPILSTRKMTSAFMAELIRWLNVKMAPCISIHACGCVWCRCSDHGRERHRKKRGRFGIDQERTSSRYGRCGGDPQGK